MKLIKIGGEFYNAEIIVRIKPGSGSVSGVEQETAVLYFADGGTVLITRQSLDRIFDYTGKSEIEIETVDYDWEGD